MKCLRAQAGLEKLAFEVTRRWLAGFGNCATEWSLPQERVPLPSLAWKSVSLNGSLPGTPGVTESRFQLILGIGSLQSGGRWLRAGPQGQLQVLWSLACGFCLTGVRVSQ